MMLVDKEPARESVEACRKRVRVVAVRARLRLSVSEHPWSHFRESPAHRLSRFFGSGLAVPGQESLLVRGAHRRLVTFAAPPFEVGARDGEFRPLGGEAPPA
jgi:hypothetical protein